MQRSTTLAYFAICVTLALAAALLLHAVKQMPPAQSMLVKIEIPRICWNAGRPHPDTRHRYCTPHWLQRGENYHGHQAGQRLEMSLPELQSNCPRNSDPQPDLMGSPSGEASRNDSQSS